MASSSTAEVMDSGVCAGICRPGARPIANTNSPSITRSIATETPSIGPLGAAKVSHSNGTGSA
ncbi:hypothetical protein D3C84_775950 [compost metagenome]